MFVIYQAISTNLPCALKRTPWAPVHTLSENCDVLDKTAW